nr:uncharacterized protein LOC109420611 [Aedes albopictus]
MSYMPLNLQYTKQFVMYLEPTRCRMDHRTTDLVSVAGLSTHLTYICDVLVLMLLESAAAAANHGRGERICKVQGCAFLYRTGTNEQRVDADTGVQPISRTWGTEKTTFDGQVFGAGEIQRAAIRLCFYFRSDGRLPMVAVGVLTGLDHGWTATTKYRPVWLDVVGMEDDETATTDCRTGRRNRAGCRWYGWLSKLPRRIIALGQADAVGTRNCWWRSVKYKCWKR